MERVRLPFNRSSLPIPPKGMNRKDAYHFRLTHYHILFVKGIREFKQKYNERLPSSEQELADILGLNRRTISLWLKRINKAGLLPNIRLIHYHQLFTEAIEKYKRKHHGRLPPSYPVLADISGVSTRTIFTWVKRINESELLPKIETATPQYRLARYAHLFSKFIDWYQATHNGNLPSEKEVAEVLKIRQDTVSRWIKRINESGLFSSICTRGVTPQKRKRYVTDEKIIRAYVNFGRRKRKDRKLPTQIKLGDILNIHHTTLSSRLRKMPIVTKGMSKKKRRRYINENEFMDVFNSYKERHIGALPSQSDLARILRVDQLTVSNKLLRINIKNLSEGKRFLRTRGFDKILPREPKEFFKITSPSPSFENLEDAVIDLCLGIDDLIRDTEKIKKLAQFYKTRSIILLKSFLLSSKKTLEKCLQDKAFYLTPRLISGPKGKVLAHCEGNKFYIYYSMSLKGTRFLKQLLLEALLLALFFKAPNFIREIQGALLKYKK